MSFNNGQDQFGQVAIAIQPQMQFDDPLGFAECGQGKTERHRSITVASRRYSLPLLNLKRCLGAN